jgi:hypothetical protein
MKIRLLACFILLSTLLLSAGSAWATTYNWTGLGLNTNWNNNGNWSPATGFPGSGDVAQIGVSVFIGTSPTINTTGLSCASLTIGNATTVTLTVSNPFTVVGAITINGSCTFTGGSKISAASLSAGAYTFTLNTPLALTGVFTTNGSTVNSNATGTINTAGLTMTSSTLTLNGVLTSTGVVQVPGAGTTTTLTTNGAGNSLTGGVYDHTGSNLTWNGSGTATCSSVDVSSGQTLTIGPGNTITVTGAFELHGNNPQTGILVNSGNITEDASIFSDNISTAFTSFTNNSSGTITLASSSATFNIGSSTALSNSGTITFNSGTSSTLGASSTITNNSGGTITMTSATMNLSGNPSTLTNGGTLTMTSSTLNATGTAPVISNSGTFNASGTTATLSGNSLSFTNTGTLSETSASAFNFSGNPQSLTNSGNISLNASTMTISGNSTPIINSGNFNLSSASTFTISGGGSSPLTNSGNFTATSSTLSFSSGTGNTITNSGVFSATSTPITFSSGAWTVNNSGSFSALTGSTITMPGNNSVIKSTAGMFTVTSSNIALNGQPSSIQNSGTSTFSASGSTVTLAQNAYITQTSSNSFTLNGGSIVNFGYGAYIANSSTFYGGTSNSSCVFNVTTQSAYMTNSTSSGNFFLGSTSIINITGYGSSVTNAAASTFTLQSDQYGSASIGAINSTATGMVGLYNVQRYFQGSTTYDNVKKRWLERGYRIISSPVHNTTQVSGNNVSGLNYIVGSTAGQTTGASSTTNAFISGCSGGNTTAGNPSIYLFKESLTPANGTFVDGNFLGITNITNSSTTGYITCSDGVSTYSIPSGNGVLFFFRGAATNWATRTTSPFIAPENVTLTSNGTINQQTVTVKDWYTPSSAYLARTGSGSGGNHAVRGFNLIGNPYPCSIDWNTAYANTGISRVNVTPTIYVFNPRTYQYDTYITSSSSTGTGTGNATNIIASGQGFFIQADTTNASISFTENAKAATSLPTGTGLYMGTPNAQVAGTQFMRLKLTIDSLNYDDIALIFNASASPKYDYHEDAAFLPGNGALEGLSSFSEDSVRLAINSLPLPGLTPRVIKLDVQAYLEGTFSLDRTALGAIPKLFDIWLMDANKKDSLDMRNNSSYVFDVTASDTTSYGPNRFQLVIRQNPALMVHLLNFTGVKKNDASQIVWVTENEENYTNFAVERSTDGGNTFNIIGSVASNAQGTYSLLDSKPLNGANLYRLKIQDLNGTITYSNIVTIMYSNTTGIASNISVYPNPSSGLVNISINAANNTANINNGLSALQTASVTPTLTSSSNTSSASYNIKIVSITGEVIKTATTTSVNWQDNVSSLSPGTYIIQVINNKDNSVVGKSTFIKL